MTFEPKILAFCCNWCSYAGADLAGVSRFQYSPNVRIIRVMCSGRVETSFVLQALREGADGVIVTGCHPGDCHYINGNEKAERRFKDLKELLKTLGIDPKRVTLEWISASEGQRFANKMTEFVERIKALGPNPYIRTNKPGSGPGGNPGHGSGGNPGHGSGGNPGHGSGGTSDHEASDGPDGHTSIKVRHLPVILDEKTGLEHCIECNKCAASCPITRVKSAYSPTRNVLTVALDPGPEAPVLPDVWDCLTCGLCSQRCPSGVRYDELIRYERIRTLAKGGDYHCAHGEALRYVMEFMTEPSLKQERMGWLTDDIEVSDKGEYLFFVGCQPYLPLTIFSDGTEGGWLWRMGYTISNIARSVVSIMNKAGIVPAVMADERCCGHDPLWSGDEATFEKLARLNMERIRATGAKVIVVSCAECYRTLKLDYPRVAEDFDIEVLHTSELYDRLIKEGRLVMEPSEDMTLAYQDPCRLSRHTGVVEEPRSVLGSIPGVKIMELGLGGKDTMCCGGPNSWINCGQKNRLIQFEKLREVKASGADTVVTACPKCLIHLSCALGSRLPSDIADLKADLVDINLIVDKRSRGGGKK
jgi:Fe-S oxidoreductase/coenzyme F420-reducing hydrogenase delta subunit